jgi:hypothetical protein
MEIPRPTLADPDSKRVFEVPAVEPAEWAAFFGTPGSKAPVGGAEGTVYARAPIGPSSLELAKAALKWF